MKKIVVIILFIILAVVAAAFLLSKKTAVANTPIAHKPSISVKLTDVLQSSLTPKKNHLATVSADKSIQLSSKLSGYIQHINVNDGESVHKGDLLVQIDATEIKTNINSLKSSLLAMKQDLAYKEMVYERNLKLYEKKALSKEKLDLSAVVVHSAKANIQVSEQKLKSLKNQLSYLNIKAPFDAVVSTVFMHKGDLSLPGKPILKLNSKEQKLTFTFVNEQIKKGQKVLHNNSEVGTIKTIYDDAKNGLKVAEVQLSKPLKAVKGESVTIDVVFEKVKGCLVDKQAILYNDTKTSLVLYKENHFMFFNVDVLLIQDNMALISECPKERVALASQSKLSILPQYKDINIIGEK